jgi:hypothetical protein
MAVQRSQLEEYQIVPPGFMEAPFRRGVSANRRVYQGDSWWRRWDSNPRPPQCDPGNAGALTGFEVPRFEERFAFLNDWIDFGLYAVVK